MSNTLKLLIEGMHCEGCVRRVTAALQSVKGVEPGAVAVGSAQITFRPELASVEEITGAVSRIGFSVRIE